MSECNKSSGEYQTLEEYEREMKKERGEAERERRKREKEADEQTIEEAWDNT